MIERIAERVRRGVGPGEEFVVGVGVTGDELLVDTEGPECAPFVVIAFQPDFEKVFELAVAGYVGGREVTMVIENGFCFREGVVEPAGGFCRKQKIIVNKGHGESTSVTNNCAVGILVHGDNHLILRGPKPEEQEVRDLVRWWSVVQIGVEMPEHLRGWVISSKEFRENLSWAVVVAGEGDVSGAVKELLEELQERGIEVHYTHETYKSCA